MSKIAFVFLITIFPWIIPTQHIDFSTYRLPFATAGSVRIPSDISLYKPLRCHICFCITEIICRLDRRNCPIFPYHPACCRVASPAYGSVKLTLLFELNNFPHYFSAATSLSSWLEELQSTGRVFLSQLSEKRR